MPSVLVAGPCNEGVSDDEISPTSVTKGPTAPLQLPRLRVPSAARSLHGPSRADEPCKLRERLKRRRDQPWATSPTSRAADGMVLREKLPMNRGRRPEYLSGLPGKLYHRCDVVGPLIDSMTMMYFRLGWAPPPRMALEEQYMHLQGRYSPTEEEQIHDFGYGPAPPPQAPTPLCRGCLSSNRSDFTMTADKSHMVCKCGVVASMMMISQDREKNCAREDDKTTHADKPYEPKTDRFDHPAQSCEELRKQREREAMGSRISTKAKQKMGVGWTHEHSAREAARADRQRQEMEPKDQTKGQHIQIELDKLFTPLEPLDATIKRYCRMAADRAWRESVRHCAVCEARGHCQLSVKEKGAGVIADAVLASSLNTLLDGDVELPGVTHAALLVVANKLGAQQGHKGTPCALRAVHTKVSALLSVPVGTPVVSCPVAVKAAYQPTPAALTASSASSASSSRPALDNAPFTRNDSSVSDFGDDNPTLKLRDALISVFHALGTAMPNCVREGALRVIQDPGFRGALAVAQTEDGDVSSLPNAEGLAYVLLAATARHLSVAGASRKGAAPASILASFGVPLPRLEAAIGAIGAILPASVTLTGLAQNGDGLFS